MEIQLHNTQVNKLRLDPFIEKKSTGKGNPTFLFDFQAIYSDIENDVFGIRFFIKSEQPKHYFLEIDYVAWFKTNETIDDEFKSSYFTTVNAPAIAFPFLRSFVSILTLNSGYPPFILPTINFIRLEEKRKDGESR